MLDYSVNSDSKTNFSVLQLVFTHDKGGTLKKGLFSPCVQSEFSLLKHDNNQKKGQFRKAEIMSISKLSLHLIMFDQI